MSKDLIGDLELHVKFVVFDLKAKRDAVVDHELLSTLEELGNEIIQHDTNELLEEVNVSIEGKDPAKIGGELILKVKYMGMWLMKIKKNVSLQNYKSEIMLMIQYLQRTHDQLKQGTPTPANVIPVRGEKVFGDEYD